MHGEDARAFSIAYNLVMVQSYRHLLRSFCLRTMLRIIYFYKLVPQKVIKLAQFLYYYTCDTEMYSLMDIKAFLLLIPSIKSLFIKFNEVIPPRLIIRKLGLCIYLCEVNQVKFGITVMGLVIVCHIST